jgi:HSP20 family protein
MQLFKGSKKGNGDIAAREESALARLRDEFDNMFDRMWRGFEPAPFAALSRVAIWPAIDETEDDKAITLRIDVPGLEAKDVEVEVLENKLTIRGQREEKTEEKGANYVRQERHAGSFARTIELPPYAQAEKIDAKYDKGVLTVTIPKTPGAGPKKVPVKVA